MSIIIFNIHGYINVEKYSFNLFRKTKLENIMLILFEYY